MIYSNVRPKTPSLLNLTFWFYISIFKHSLEIVWHICLYLYRCAMHIFAHHHWICMRFRFWWQSEGSASSTIQIFLVSDVRRCNLSHRLMMLCYLGLAFHFLLVYISIWKNSNSSNLKYIFFCFQNAVIVWMKRKQQIDGRCQRRSSATNDITLVHFSKYVSICCFSFSISQLITLSGEIDSTAHGVRNLMT